jgi:tetratricopeptide (TPR) repeat protein
MISNLSRLYRDHLVVIPNASVARYTGSNRHIDEIGRDLKVDYVVEGGVNRKGNQVLINARLLRVSDQTPLWIGSFERDLEQLLSVQADLAEVIGQGIENTLRQNSDVRRTLARKVNADAYEAYLRGDYEKSIELDPTYAPAHSGLAWSLLSPAWFGFAEPRPAYAKIMAAASKALELDSTLAEAHAILALAKLQNFKWKEAAEGFHLAMKLNPSNSVVRHLFGHYLLWMDRPRESAEECMAALEHDPFDTGLMACTAWHDLWAGDYDKAIGAVRRALSFEPDNKFAFLVMGWAYEQRGMFQDALSVLQKAGDNTPQKAAMAEALARSGRRVAAEEILKELLKQSEKKYTSAYDIAIIYTSLGQTGSALEWLEKAYAERSGFLLYLKSDPRLKALRTEPGFQDVLGRMGLSQRRV